MGWDFETDPAYQSELDWADRFVREEVEALDHALGNPLDRSDPAVNALVDTLRRQVKDRGLWACHLGPELGGPGFGQVQLALLNEVLGRSRFAPVVFGCQAPDSGNAEILARFGTPEQKARFLQPLLDGAIFSCYSMTEPQGGSDPKVFATRAVRDGNEWVISGEKWFSSNARYAAFFIVMAVTDPDAERYGRMSMFLVPAETPGIEIIRNVGVGTERGDEGEHAYLRYDGVRIPADALLGERGDAFAIAQVRLGGGRIHHAMRTIAQVRKVLDMLCERVLSRETQGELLARKQMVQEQIADAWLELEQFRLLVLRTAWLIDKHQDYRKVRGDIAAVKAAMPKVFVDAVYRAMHLHGALGVSNEMPFTELWVRAAVMGIVDGPTEVHKVTLAREVLKGYSSATGPWPTEHLPSKRDDARRKLADVLDLEAAEF